MRLPRLLTAVLLLAFLAVPPLCAQVAGSPYAVTVPVSDTSQAGRDEAFATALGQVLVRVAGGQDLRGKAGYDDALAKAPSLVQQFQYAKGDGGGLVLQVNFEPGAVRRLVSTLGVASAGVKPPVLLAVQGSDGQWLQPDDLAALAQAAATGGANIAYVDAGNPPDPARVAAADPAALAALDVQYHTGLVLLGHLHDGAGDWTLVSGGKAQHWSNQGDTEDAVLADAGRSLVGRVNQQLNVVGATVTSSRLWVDGLGSAMAYANLLATLQGEPAVRAVATLGAQDDGVMLEVKAALPAAALATSLAAGGRLLQGAPHDGADASLRWLH